MTSQAKAQTHDHQFQIPPQLEIPQTLAAGPGPGNTDPRVLERYAAAGVADHMQADVIRGMKEAKLMLREVFGTQNVYTYAVVGTGGVGSIAPSRRFCRGTRS